jgi:hypothetical protein
MDGRIEAQRRADRIAAFRAELAALKGEGALALPEEQRAQVLAHQDGLLRDLAARMLGEIFSITPSAGAFLAWGALGLALA